MPFNHGSSFQKSNYNTFKLIGRNSQPSHTKIPRSSLIVMRILNFLKSNLQFYFHNFLNFVDKIREFMKIKDEKIVIRKSCVCSLVQIRFTLGTMTLEPWPHEFFMILFKKWGTMKFYKPWLKVSSINHP